MAFLRTLLKRLLQGLALVLAVVVLNFMLVHAAPGDPVETIAGASGGMEPELMAELRTRYGLDRPLPVQLGIYLARVASGDLGYSYFFNLPVAQMIAERVPATLLLAAASMLVAVLIAVPAGVAAALRRGSWVDHAVSGVAVLGKAMPNFWVAIMLILVFGVSLRWLPVSGSGTWAHLVMPALTLGTAFAGDLAKLVRASMLETLG